MIRMEIVRGFRTRFDNIIQEAFHRPSGANGSMARYFVHKRGIKWYASLTRHNGALLGDRTVEGCFGLGRAFRPSFAYSGSPFHSSCSLKVSEAGTQIERTPISDPAASSSAITAPNLTSISGNQGPGRALKDSQKPTIAASSKGHIDSKFTIRQRARPPSIKQQATPIREASSEISEERKVSLSRRVRDLTVLTKDALKNGLFTTARLTAAFIREPLILETWIYNGWSSFKHFIQHTWTGFRLLGLETRTSFSLARKRLSGYQLTRRERRQLVRTSADLARMGPVLFFLIVPFMEFLLPFALKIFPNMLPSTFQDDFKAEENMKKQLKLRLEMASFMQEMVEEMETKAKAYDEKVDVNPTTRKISVDDVRVFMDRVRAGATIDSDTVLRVANLFNDELTTDNMSRSQLVSLCKYMDLVSIGSDDFLRFQLRNKINALREDDAGIYFEGVDALNLLELKQACQDRGMRATGLTMHQLRTQLARWIDLSVNKNVPLSLLILSRIFTLAGEPTKDVHGLEKTEAALSEALSQMDEEVLHEALVKGAESSGVTADASTLSMMKLEAIKAQNERIEAEIEEQKRKAAFLETLRLKAQRDLDAATAAIDVSSTLLIDSVKSDDQPERHAYREEGAKSPSSRVNLQEEIESGSISRIDKEIVQEPPAPDVFDISSEGESKEKSGAKDSQDNLEKELAETVAAVKVLASQSSLVEEKSILESVLEKQDEMDAANAVASGRIIKDDDTSVSLGRAGSVSHQEPQAPSSSKDKTQRYLKDKIKNMLRKLEVDMETTDAKIGGKLKLLDMDNDGKISDEELRAAVKAALKLSPNVNDESMHRIIDRLDLDRDGIIRIDELDEILQELQHKKGANVKDD